MGKGFARDESRAVGAGREPSLCAVLPGGALFVCTLAVWFFLAESRGASVTIDGSETNQLIDGFGVNANYYSWTNSELIPALDALIDEAGMTLFRVIFSNGWETANDNTDPNVMNWSYYNALYSGPEFQKL